jgi:hypothetical protein
MSRATRQDEPPGGASMATTKDIKYVRITIRLGKRQSFEISADEGVRVNPNDADFDAASIDGSPDEVAVQVLTKLLAAFQKSDEAINVIVEGNRIQPDGKSPDEKKDKGYI